MAFFGRKKVDDDKGDDFIGTPEMFQGNFRPITPSFDHIRPAPVQVDNVDPMAGLQSAIDKHVMPVQNNQSNLAYFRSSFPFVQIVPWPAFSKVVALAAGVAFDMSCRDKMLVRFKGNGDYFVSFDNKARVPLVGDDDTQNQSLYKPEDDWYYIGGKNQLSIIAPGADIVVCAQFFTTENWPKV